MLSLEPKGREDVRIFEWDYLQVIGLPWLSDKESTYQCRSHRRRRLSPRVRKIPWERKSEPTLVFLPGESQGQKNLADYGLWGHKESDTT